MTSPDGANIAHFFKRGAGIEICCSDDGFHGSWYTGTVVCPPEYRGESSKVIVEYDTLLENSKSTKRLREEVDIVHLRPSPPVENCRSFKISDNVDAYYRDGWWEGFVRDVLEDGRYLVFFRGSREKIAFRGSKLRRHHEWDFGVWIPPFETSLPEPTPASTCSVEDAKLDSQNKKSPKNRKHEMEVPSSPGMSEPTKMKFEHDFAEGDRIEVQSDDPGLKGSWYAAKIVKKLMKGKYLVKYKTLRNDDDTGCLKEEVDCSHIRPLPPAIEVIDNFEVREQVDAFYNDGWWVGVIRRIHINGMYSVYFEDTEEELKFKHADLRVHQEWKNGEWTIPPKVQCLLKKGK